MAARAAGVHVVAFTGADGGELAGLADIELRVPSDDTGRVQESHVVFVHAISEQVESGLFGRA